MNKDRQKQTETRERDGQKKGDRDNSKRHFLLVKSILEPIIPSIIYTSPNRVTDLDYFLRDYQMMSYPA